MAEKIEIEKEPEKGEDTGGTLQDALNRAKQESIFTGHPAKDTPLEGPEDEPGKGDDKDQDKGGDKDKGDQDKETPKEEPSKTEESEKFEFKYKSHEEAEKGYREATGKMHEATTEAKKARERAETLQNQINELTIQVSKLRETPVKEEEPSSQTPGRIAALLKDIERLEVPTEDNEQAKAEYQNKVAEIWAKALDEGISDGVVRELERREKVAEQERQKKERADSTSKGVVQLATTRATEAKLDMKKDSDDSKLFWAMADLAPEGDIESQVDWTIKEVQRIKGAIGSRYTEAADKAKHAQEENEVLDRHGGGRPADKPEHQTPLSLASAFKANERRI